MLKDAPILILDEATSQLDTESEQLVEQALAVLMQRRTVIVLATSELHIRRADKIVVLDSGRIVETGTHNELVNFGGMYKRLYELQHLMEERRRDDSVPRCCFIASLWTGTLRRRLTGDDGY